MISIDLSNSTAVMFSWALKTDGVIPTWFMLYYVSDEMTPINETVGSAVRQYTVSNLQPGVTLSISLVALSDHLPSEAATESVILKFRCKLSISAACIFCRQLLLSYDTFLFTLSVAIRIADPGVLTVGQPATLNCSSDFSGAMISSIQWLNAESVVEDMTSKQQSLVLVIDTTTDNLTNTTYTCSVTHINGTVYMHNIVLVVEGEV